MLQTSLNTVNEPILEGSLIFSGESSASPHNHIYIYFFLLTTASFFIKKVKNISQERFLLSDLVYFPAPFSLFTTAVVLFSRCLIVFKQFHLHVLLFSHQ